MRKGQRKLSAFRAKLTELLKGMGYECFRRDRMKASDKWFCHAESPAVDVRYLYHDMKMINLGDAHYHAEGVAVDIAYLPGKCDPREYSCRPIEENVREFHYWLVNGTDISYPNPYREINDDGEEDIVHNLVKFIDYQQVLNNAFCAVERWQGRVDCDFMWDYIICVNSLPLVAVVVEPDEPGDAPCQKAYDAMLNEMKEDFVLKTYLQYCIISNGTEMLVGTQFEPLSEFKPWRSLMGEEMFVRMSVPPETTFMSLLRPDRLLDIIQYNMLIKFDDEPLNFFGDYHQYFSILKVVEYVENHFSESDEPLRCHVDLLKSESRLSANTRNQAGDSTLLLAFRLSASMFHGYMPDMAMTAMSGRLDDEMMDEFRKANLPILLIVESAFSTDDYNRFVSEFPTASIIQFRQVPCDDTEAVGECVYRASNPIC